MREASTSGSNSMVESQPSKLLVASSILVSRSIFQQHRRHRSSRLYSIYSVFFSEPALGSLFPRATNSKSSSSDAPMTADSSFVTASIF
jgi:hypothetical protein